MPEFIPIDESQENNQLEDESANNSMPDIQKARDNAEIKKHEADAKEYEMKAKFAEASIRTVDELVDKYRQADNKLQEINQMYEVFNQEKKSWGKKTQEIIKKIEADKIEWERLKANEQAGIEINKATLDKRETELNNRGLNLDVLQQNVDAAWAEVREIRASLNAEKLKKLQQEEENKKLINRLQNGSYEQYYKLMNPCLDILWRSGFKGLVRNIDSDLRIMGKWARQETSEKFGELVWLMQEQIKAVNKKASIMARNDKDYLPSSWNSVVDNLERIIELIPEIKPDDWVDGQ